MVTEYNNMYYVDFDKVEGNTYELFIEKAIEQSDKLTFEIYRTHELLSTIYREEEVIQWYRENCNFNEETIKKLAREFVEEQYDVNDAYNKSLESTCFPFLDKIKPYVISETNGHYVLPAIPEIIPMLKEVGSLTKWTAPYYPDDIAFIKNDKFWFLSETHENYAYLCPSNDENLQYWKHIGVIYPDATPVQVTWDHRRINKTNI